MLRHARSRAISASCLLCAAVILAAPAPAARLAASKDWIPLSKGNRWSYRVTTDRTFEIPGVAPQEQRASGSDVEEVTRSLGSFAGASNAWEIVSTRREGGEKTVQTMVVSGNAGRFVMHTGTVDDAPLKILSPVVMLPARLEPGHRWDGGEVEVGGLRIHVEGRVEGYESVSTPAGVFSNALKVAFRGTVTGAVEFGGSRIPLKGARLNGHEWFAAGVGLVKETTVIRMAFEAPNGMDVQAEERTQRVLDAYQVGGAGTFPAAPVR